MQRSCAPFFGAISSATGYIGKRNVDIGDHVRQGELLAELAVPEQDDQISQNEATRNQLQSALDQAQANLKLAQVTWDRDRPLVSEGWATQQQGTIDVQTLKADDAAVGVARANIAAQDKLLMTLHQNRDYASVTAPFNGVITQRNEARLCSASASPSRGPGNGILWAETGGRFQPQNAGERPEFGSQTATRLTNRPELRGFLPARKPRRFAGTVWWSQTKSNRRPLQCH